MNVLESAEEVVELKKFMKDNDIETIEFSGDMSYFFGSDENQLTVVGKSGDKREDVKGLILDLLDGFFGGLEHLKKVKIGGEGTVSLSLDHVTNVLKMKLDCTVTNRVTETLQI